METEVKINYICDNPTPYQRRDKNGINICNPDGSPVMGYIYTLYVKILETGKSIFVDAFRTKDELERYGIKAEAIGTLEFDMEGKESKSSNFKYNRVTMKRFRLANAGIFQGNVPAASGSQQTPPPAAEVAFVMAEAAQEAEASGDLPY